MANIRVFQGRDTQQINGLTGAPAQPLLWYFEPINYEGDTLWSRPFAYRADAVAAGAAETEEHFNLGACGG